MPKKLLHHLHVLITAKDRLTRYERQLLIACLDHCAQHATDDPSPLILTSAHANALFGPARDRVCVERLKQACSALFGRDLLYGRPIRIIQAMRFDEDRQEMTLQLSVQIRSHQIFLTESVRDDVFRIRSLRLKSTQHSRQ